MVLTPRVEPWTLLSGASPGEFNHTLSSAEAEREGGLKEVTLNNRRIRSKTKRSHPE